ncbi:NTP pyrophosphatase (non-canonical NTP hydrolase) [Bacillus horti]|uniref:NTP pyrophosphatase (Non-canonical NTP hydrolase) n=1 Tax=Caldalkalibacillus horti TaxID=77523 RepID=A0ABT9W0U1_9BACI|nr:NTP pyrophosphatase (non-canonical NTP hydrolase) [Bacillus horti]
MNKVQELYKEFEKEMGFGMSGDKENPEDSKLFLLYVHMLLTTEVAEVAEEFRKIFYLVKRYTQEGMDPQEAYAKAKQEVRVDLGKELADCLAYICKLGNFFDYDLEDELSKKLNEIRSTRKQPRANVEA